MEFPQSAVNPVRPIAPYIGGKRNLAKRITGLIETIPHELFVDVFVGMGGIFLRRRRRPAGEVINDWSGEVANLFRILQEHYVAFLEMMRFQLTSRREFERLMRVDPSTLTDLRRAARFLYLQRLAFGGKVDGRAFAVDARGARFDVTKLQPMLEDLHERLADVVIENLPWAAAIDRYDRPGALFYLDPPYYGCETDYGRDLFGRDEFEQMAERLACLQGRFVLSINDRPETRAIFGRFELAPVDLTYRISGAPTAAKELIITG